MFLLAKQNTVTWPHHVLLLLVQFEVTQTHVSTAALIASVGTIDHLLFRIDGASKITISCIHYSRKQKFHKDAKNSNQDETSVGAF